MPDTRIVDPVSERLVINAMNLSSEGAREIIDLFNTLLRQAALLPGGHVLKRVWDEAGGYPKHSWGYVQYSVRPYQQGYGCDGTTDRNVHAIAAILCQRIGIDYAKAHVEAYPENNSLEERSEWVRNLTVDQALLYETIVPDNTSDMTLRAMLHDLYDLNNRSLVDVLEQRLAALGRDLSDWHVYDKNDFQAVSMQHAPSTAAA